MKLADKLKQLRSKSALSMSQVSRLSESASDHRGRITQGYISRLESGKETNPSMQKIITLCRIYKVDANDIFAAVIKKRSSKSRK